MQEIRVVLVDESDKEIGTEEKLAAHKKGLLHRAFSIFVINSKGEMLIQRRAMSKYHSGGLWSNACCSHPHPNEKLQEATHRRLEEEMGFDCDLKEKFSFIYKTNFENGLVEHEFLHIFIGTWDATPKVDPEEADEWAWIDMAKLQADLATHPEKYTYWFKLALPKIILGI
ncbi:MAG: isopentenyl-diphosphate Delta-isomerase [Patescibacteria group bacterium]